RARLFPLEKCVAKEFVAHEADDALAAPDVVPEKIRDPFEMRVGARDRITQIEPILADRRVWQIRSLRLLQHRRPALRPQHAVPIAALDRNPDAAGSVL